jgi:CheY-like chemotaxis protein
VLLVEDNAINRLVATKLLEKLNIKPAIAIDGVEAVAMTEKTAYDLVLMDMQMPNMDGLTATQHIRAMNLSRQPIIIALTANAMAEDQERCFAAGMNDFISKPISFDQLKQKIANYFN